MNKSETTQKSDWDDEDSWDDWADADGDENESGVAAEKIKATSETPSQSNKHVEVPEKTKNANHTNKAGKEIATTPQQSPQITSKSLWGWGMVSSVLSTAHEGLGNITSTVSQGLNQVIGVPDPEELARLNAAAGVKEREMNAVNEESAKAHESKIESRQHEQLATAEAVGGAPVFGLNLVSGVTTLGSKVLNTGLDTLEGIGKKTMTMLQENDPMLKNKRKMLGLEPDRPNLSEILKAAKKDADQMEHALKELEMEKSRQQLCFETLFENSCGLVHLEALELLSKESALKLRTLLDSVSGQALIEIQETIEEVKELAELEGKELLDESEGDNSGDYNGKELGERLMAAMDDDDLQIHCHDIVSTWDQLCAWLAAADGADAADEQTIFAKSIAALSSTCALEMNKLHKIAELLLVKEHHSTANEVDSIVQLCKQFTNHLYALTNRCGAVLSARNSDEAKTYVSTLFTELQVAMEQIQKAFNLFLPILQIGAV